jgi:virulence-associated protein VagC
MTAAEISRHNGIQSVNLPREFQFDVDAVSIRREGEAVILEPVKPTSWPLGFFESIRVDDPGFERPDQGQLPTSSTLN